MEMPTLHCAPGFLLGCSVYSPLLAPKRADLAKIILQHAQTREAAPGPHELCFLVPKLQSQVLGHSALSGKKKEKNVPS